MAILLVTMCGSFMRNGLWQFYV